MDPDTKKVKPDKKKGIVHVYHNSLGETHFIWKEK